MTAPLLDEGTLARFRRIQEANMPSLADLIVYSVGRLDGAGSGLTPHTRTTVPCRVAAQSATLPFIAEQPTPEVVYTITMPVGTDITGVQRIIVRGATAGVPWAATMDVIGPAEPRSYEASVRLLAHRAADTEIAPTPIGTVTVVEA